MEVERDQTFVARNMSTRKHVRRGDKESRRSETTHNMLLVSYRLDSRCWKPGDNTLENTWTRCLCRITSRLRRARYNLDFVCYYDRPVAIIHLECDIFELESPDFVAESVGI